MKKNFICLSCFAEFDEWAEVVERHCLDTPPYEKLQVCPQCYGENISTAIYCDLCSCAIHGEYIVTVDGDVFCDDCYVKRNVEDLI